MYLTAKENKAAQEFSFESCDLLSGIPLLLLFGWQGFNRYESRIAAGAFKRGQGTHRIGASGERANCGSTICFVDLAVVVVVRCCRSGCLG